MIYTIEGESLKDIVKQFRKLIGRSYIPPKWAFGYQQCKWSYMNEDEIRDVVRNHRDNQIPLDAVYLDIDYMERYKDFTINEETFPDFPAFVSEMKEDDIHLVPIIDAGVKIEEGYSVYEEGVANNYFCKDEEGNDFVAAVWPGRVHFPDMLNSKARAWFGEKYRFLIEQGIDGFWNDMNEPAIFYSEKNLNNVIDKIAGLKGQNLDIYGYFGMKNMVNALANNANDYKGFYHDMDGIRVRHDKVHNLYGFNMTKAASEAFDKIEPEKRILMFSRHNAMSMRNQEVYRFNAIKDFRNIIRIRYALLPYLYSEYMKAVIDDEMYFRPLAFDYPEDEHTYQVEDQLMVHLKSPEEKKMTSMKKGHHYVEIALNELVIFIKKGHVLPMAVLDENIKSTKDIDENNLEWIGYSENKAEYILYTDDGISKNTALKEPWINL